MDSMTPDYQSPRTGAGKNLVPYSVGKLCGKAFYIPDYQRGYRWNVSQVRDLLEDVRDFSRKSDANAVYCLQPLVVMPERKWVKNSRGQDEEREVYVVIDGQQRLTTIRLILGTLASLLNDGVFSLPDDAQLQLPMKEDMYSLHYATREDSAVFIEKLFDKDKCGDAEAAADRNIDYHHIWQAHQLISDYLNPKPDLSTRAQGGAADFGGIADALQLAAFAKALINQVQFIWYKPPRHTNAVDVFSRLNKGKIGLTDSELIKALLLNRSYINNKSDTQLSIMQQEIALQWDMIENDLGNNEFWYFLTMEPPPETRIDFIFDIVYQLERCGPSAKWDNYGSFNTFRYFDDFLKRGSAHYYDSIKAIWSEIMDLYLLFREWYDDADLYHYVGFLLCKEGRYTIANRACPDKAVYTLWKGDKYSFLQAVRRRVWEVCLFYGENKNRHHTNKLDARCSKWSRRMARSNADLVGPLPRRACDMQEFLRGKDRDAARGRLKRLLFRAFSHVCFRQGNSDLKTQCRPLLLLHNIQTAVIQNRNSVNAYKIGVFYKFPFHLYNRINWEVEHIDSATENKLQDDAERKIWLLHAYSLLKNERDYWKLQLDDESALEFLRCHDELRRLMNTYFDPDAQANKDNLFASLKETMEQRLDCASPSSRKDYLQNFCLLDKSTNASYQNVIFPAKRAILIERERGIELPGYDWNGNPGVQDIEVVKPSVSSARKQVQTTFVMPCTMAAFLKKYSGYNANPNQWAEPDAEAYLGDICEKLTDFLLS